jgi:hypothetical protein
MLAYHENPKKVIEWLSEASALLSDLENVHSTSSWDVVLFYGVDFPTEGGAVPSEVIEDFNHKFAEAITVLRRNTTKTIRPVWVKLDYPPSLKDKEESHNLRESSCGSFSVYYKHMGRFRAFTMWRMPIIRGAWSLLLPPFPSSSSFSSSSSSFLKQHETCLPAHLRVYCMQSTTTLCPWILGSGFPMASHATPSPNW